MALFVAFCPCLCYLICGVETRRSLYGDGKKDGAANMSLEANASGDVAVLGVFECALSKPSRLYRQRRAQYESSHLCPVQQ